MTPTPFIIGGDELGVGQKIFGILRSTDRQAVFARSNAVIEAFKHRGRKSGPHQAPIFRVIVLIDDSPVLEEGGGLSRLGWIIGIFRKT